MRKILLGTTAVVGAALLGVTGAQAQTAPTVRVGGFMLTQMNYNDDDLDKATGVAPTGVAGAGRVSRDKIDFKNEVEISVFVNGKAANGMSYGAVIEIQNDGTGGTIFDIDEAYVFVSSPTLGTVRFGEEDNAASLLQVRAPSITGMGTDGDWDDGLISSTAFTGGGPSLITGINDGNDSTKIVYLSPQFFGFDFGLSYAPNQNEGDRIISGRAVDSLSTAGAGFTATSVQRDPVTLTNEISGALRYRGSFGNVGVQVGFGAMRADGTSSTSAGVPLTPPGRDVTAYTTGAQVSAFGFTLGGEYTWGNYSGASVGRASLAPGRDASSHWALGLTYVTGAISVGGFYGLGTQDNGAGAKDREQTVWGIGAAYTLAPGLDVYTSFNQLSDKNNAGLGNIVTNPIARQRDASVFLLGTRIAF
jgi:predicted porin